MSNNFAKDFANGVGKIVERYYPEFLVPEAQFMFDTAVVAITTRTVTQVTAQLAPDQKTLNPLIAGEVVLGGIAELMCYYRYCSAKSARRQYRPEDHTTRNAQDAEWREM